MHLRDYLTINEVTVSAFAERVDATPEAVRLWIAGERTPRPEFMRRIMVATGGKVSANDFVKAA